MSADRKAFEAWYVENAFDLAASPLGSRDCALQWAAWQARGKSLAPLLSGARDALAACNVAGWPEKLDDAIDAADCEMQTVQVLSLVSKFADVETDRRGRKTYSMDSYGVLGFARAIGSGNT